jgi:hypothetical protein
MTVEYSRCSSITRSIPSLGNCFLTTDFRHQKCWEKITSLHGTRNPVIGHGISGAKNGLQVPNRVLEPTLDAINTYITSPALCRLKCRLICHTPGDSRGRSVTYLQFLKRLDLCFVHWINGWLGHFTLESICFHWNTPMNILCWTSLTTHCFHWYDTLNFSQAILFWHSLSFPRRS